MENNKKTCACCGKEKDSSEFSPDDSRKDGLNRVCRQCRSMKRRKRCGNAARALRFFTDGELIEDLLRRKSVYDLLDSVNKRDIANYMHERGYVSLLT